MDELLHHCIRELAFEGDLGCDASRLRGFITDFYKQKPPAQNADDAYCAFIWSVVAQQPEVRVGTVPEGATDVRIAPQLSKKGKGKAKDGEGGELSPQDVSLHLIPNAAEKSLEELIAEYGSALRIAVDPDKSFVAITGSHIRPSKLTPMVYTCLQLIARGRENGMSVVDLSRKTGYDAKTSHYLVEKLLDLNLIVKLKKAGVGGNLCIHKYFFEKSETWQNILAEEREAKDAVEDKEQQDDDDDDVSDQGSIRFEPIGAKHLSRLEVVRGRVEKLLKSTPHNLHKVHNMIVTIGFSNPTKSERRFFQTRLRELENEGFLEIVQVRGPKHPTKCVRLLNQEKNDDEPKPSEEAIESEASDDRAPKATVTFQRQILDIIDGTGTEGATLNTVVDALCNFDKRVIDFQLNRLKDLHPPPHIRDLGLTQLAENYGRERRYKYFTFEHYVSVAEREKLEVPFPDDYLSKAGEFRSVDENMFYEDTEALHGYLDSLRAIEDVSAKPKKKLGRPRKHPLPEGEQRQRKRKRGTGDEDAASAPPKKRGRPRKHPLLEETDADGSVSAPPDPKQRGRPRKHSLPEGDSTSAPAPKKRGRPSKRPRPEDGSVSAPAPKRRGRPPKDLHPEPGAETSTAPNGGSVSEEDELDEEMVDETIAQPASIPAPPVRERGRLPQNLPLGPVADIPNAPGQEPAPAGDTPDAGPTEVDTTQPEATTPSVAKKRGRPRKHPLSEVASVKLPAGLIDMSAEPVAELVSVSNEASQAASSATLAPKRRGRPPKARPTETAQASKKRGRPPKKKPSGAVAERGDDAEDGATENVQESEGPSVTTAEEPAQNVNDADAEHVDLSLTTTTTAESPPSALVPEVEPVVIDAIAASISNDTTGRDSLPEDFPVSHLRTSATPPDDIVIDPALLAMDSSVTQTAQNESVSATLAAPSKRTLADSPDRPSAKRTRYTGPLANISRGRRQKEILQTLENLGGIANTTQKEFHEAHATTVEALAQAGETTSTVAGSHLDKKTLTAALSELETQGKIKLLTTSITPQFGGARQVKIAYLADTPQEKLNEFLANLSRTQPQPFAPAPSLKVLDEPIVFGGNKSKKVVKPAASVILLNESDGVRDEERARRLVQADEETVRASLVTEYNTITQEYGFIMGKVARSRELYLHLARVIEEQKSPSVVCAESRIIHLSYLFQDIPISVYTSIVTIRAHNEQLLRILSTPEGRQTPVKSLPREVVEACEISSWRTRSRAMDVLTVLQGLKLVTALNPSEAEEPTVQCTPKGSHPSAFDPARDDKFTATTSAPQYWKLNDWSLLHLWELDEDNPPFWKKASTTSLAEGEQLWKELERACTDEAFCKHILDEMPAAGTLPEKIPAHIPHAIVKLLRRETQWSTMYSFSWYQQQYLNEHIDIIPAATPLQDADGGEARLAKIAWLVSAPKDQVARFYERKRHSLLNSVQKMQKRKQDAGKRKEAQKATLAQKAAEARAERERAWEDMIAHVLPEPLKGTFASRMKPVRARFLQSSGRDVEKWEAEIAKTIQEAKISAKRPAPNRRPLASVPARLMPTPPPLALAANEKSVEELIASQGPLLNHVQAKAKDKKGKGKEKDTETDKLGRRRQRFQWNKDLDELARDASAIIRARCRDGKRLDWAALEQVFPAVSRNSARQRIGHLEKQPGAGTYFRRLEDRWHELWMRYLGTPELPDEDPGSPSNFDLAAHIKFLRSHIDKNALRVGFVETERPLTAVLPASLDALDRWEVVEKPLTAPSWDFMWSGVAEEGREKQLIQQSFVLGGNELPPANEYPSEDIFVADAVLKMTLGTPNEAYDASKASNLLSAVGEAVGVAVEELLERGVLSKLVRDPTKHRPGRTLKISDANQSALNGNVAPELFQDAATLEETLSQQGGETAWQEWPLVVGDGDIAALIELVSDGKLEFNVDTSHAQSVRPIIDWNSKKAGDDDIETAIGIRPTTSIDTTSESSPQEDTTTHEADTPQQLMQAKADGHGSTADGERACCAIWSAGLADCAACLGMATQTLLHGAGPQDAGTLRSLLGALTDAGPLGLTKRELEKFMNWTQEAMLSAHLNRLTSSAVPLAFWAGYREVVLVSSQYLSSWSVVVDEDETKYARVLPRRWLDISGRAMTEVWNAARKAVMGIIIFHPDISQAELRWRLRAVYDRQEVNDVLRHLWEEGYVKRDIRMHSLPVYEGPPPNDEEKSIFWSANSQKAWYQV